MNIIETIPEIIQDYNYGLGLKATNVDPRNRLHLISDLPKQVPKYSSNYWGEDYWWGNQGQTNKCVPYAGIQWCHDSPVHHPGVVKPFYSPDLLYNQVQAIDGFPLPHEGSTTLALMKMFQQLGFIKSYAWGYTLEDLLNVILTKSACLVGTNWYEDMFRPNARGLVKIGGVVAGGHEWIVNGADIKTRLFRCKNSWGLSWSTMRHFYISFDHMERLIYEQGEVALALEVKKAA